MKIEIIRDELYPYYKVSRPNKSFRFQRNSNITTVTFLAYERIQKDFEQMQKELHELYGD